MLQFLKVIPVASGASTDALAEEKSVVFVVEDVERIFKIGTGI